MAAILKAVEAFSAFGVDYAPGDKVTQAQVAKWPEGTLQRRVVGGFVAYDDAPEVVPVADTKK